MAELPALPRVPERLVPHAGTIDVLRVDARGTQGLTGSFAGVLTRDERERAARFQRDADRRAFIAARTALRATIASVLDVRADALQLVPGVNGKPILGWPPADLHFNISHSGELCAIAIALGRRVGIDVERVHCLDDGLRIAAACFSPGERAVLMSLPAALRTDGFFACWASKESFMKATGQGLSLPLGAFTVEARPDRPAALLLHDGDPDQVSRWQMERLHLSPEHAAVLTGEGHGWQVRVWDASPQ